MKFQSFALLVGLALLANYRVNAKPRPAWKMPDIGQMGKDAMAAGNTMMVISQNFKAEDVKMIMESFQDPEEGKAYMKIMLMVCQGKSMDDIIEVLMETKSGPGMAEKMMPLLEHVDKFKGYAAGFKEFIESNKQQGGK